MLITKYIYDSLSGEMRKFVLMGIETSHMTVSHVARKILLDSKHEKFNSQAVYGEKNLLYLDSIKFQKKNESLLTNMLLITLW